MPKVGLLWRQEWDPRRPVATGWDGYRLHGVFAAFANLGAGPKASSTVTIGSITLDGAAVAAHGDRHEDEKDPGDPRQGLQDV